MDTREWFRRRTPVDLVAKCFQLLTLPLLQNWKWFKYPVAQCVKEFRHAVLHELENIPRELPVIRPLLDNDEVIHFAEALPNFEELPSQQLSKDRSNAHVREIISFTAD